MILDLQKFIDQERPRWTELERILEHLAAEPLARMDLAGVRRMHYLYERASSDLAKIKSFAAETEIRAYLESLVSRAYSEMHESRESRARFRPVRWFLVTFPQTFRRHIRCFHLALAITLAGCAFGGAAVALDPEAKETIMPWSHLGGDPSERVREEEQTHEDRLQGEKAQFSSYLMTHNIQVSIFAMSLGLTFGVGTIILLFYNGVILGAVAIDYATAGETPFLAGWLLPHGSIEIPAILIAGQAGFVLALALIGRGSRSTLRERMRAAVPDLVTLIGGTAVLLVWAGIVEAFFSQYHEPVLPYALKISIGAIEWAALVLYLSRSGADEGKAAT